MGDAYARPITQANTASNYPRLGLPARLICSSPATTTTALWVPIGISLAIVWPVSLDAPFATNNNAIYAWINLCPYLVGAESESHYI